MQVWGVQLGALVQRSAYLKSARSITGSREGPHKPRAPITPRGHRAWVRCHLAGHRYRPRCRTDAPCRQSDQGSESRCIGPEPVRRQFRGFRSSLSQVQSACFAFAHSDTDAVRGHFPCGRSPRVRQSPVPTTAPSSPHASASPVLVPTPTAEYQTPREQNELAWSEAILRAFGDPLTSANIVSMGYWMQNEAGRTRPTASSAPTIRST